MYGLALDLLNCQLRRRMRTLSWSETRTGRFLFRVPQPAIRVRLALHRSLADLNLEIGGGSLWLCLAAVVLVCSRALVPRALLRQPKPRLVSACSPPYDARV